jgi:hypothetical protein
MKDAIVEHAAGLHKALTRGQITMMGLRMTFWLGVVLVLLPHVGSQPVPKSQHESRFVRTMGAVPIPSARPSQHTLRPTDLAPPWRGPRPIDRPRDLESRRA